MQNHDIGRLIVSSVLVTGCFGLFGCGASPGVANVNLANSSTNRANSLANNGNANSSNTSVAASSAVETKEPQMYQATVTIKLEAIGEQQKTTMPTLSAHVARSGPDRRMEFAFPGGGRTVFLDKSGINYVILPEKKQYAELDRAALGFDVRRMLMPEQIVEQIKNMRGVERVGEEKYNGRDCVKYRYGVVANTQTRPGQVDTDSFLLVDKETGLPLHSETASQSQTGGNVQGYKGLRIVTEITEIKTDVSSGLFDQPTDFQKIESAQVRSQVDLIFNALSALLTQMVQQVQPATGPSATPAG